MLLKQGARQVYVDFWRQYMNPWVISGYGLMLVSMTVNIYAISHGVQVKEVSIIEALSYLFVPCFAFMFFGEKVTWRKAVAIIIIIGGVIIFFL